MGERDPDIWTAPVVVASIVVLLLSLLSPLPSVVVLGGIATVGTVVSYHRGYLLGVVLGFGFLLRLVMIVVDVSYGVLMEPPIAGSHDRYAMFLAESWRNNDFSASFQHVDIYGQGVDSMRRLVAHVLAPFYLLIGDSELSGRVGVAVFSLLIGYFVYHIAEHLTTADRAAVAAGLTLLWPSVFYRSIVIQREVLIVVALLGLLWVLVEWLDGRSWRLFPLGFLFVVAMFVLRDHNLVLILAAVTGVLLAQSFHSRRYLWATVAVGGPPLVYLLFNPDVILPAGGSLSPQLLDKFAHGRAHGDAAYLVGLHYETWFDVLFYLPIKVCYLLFAPFPWHVRGLTELAAGASGWALFVAVLVARGGAARAVRRSRASVVVLAVLLVGVASYSIIEMNYGAAFRRRIQFVPLVMIFASIGLPKIHVRFRSASQSTES